MIKIIYLSFALALENIRNRFFHTMLSILGIIIGVAALVAILSLIDGMEKYAKEQITRTTSLKAIMVSPSLYKNVDHIEILKDTYAYLDYEKYQAFQTSINLPASVYFYQNQSGELNMLETKQRVGVQARATAAAYPETLKTVFGRLFSKKEVDQATPVAFINYRLAQQIAGKQTKVSRQILGKSVQFKDTKLKIIGILQDDKSPRAQLFFPITLLKPQQLKENPPGMVIEAEEVTQVPALKVETEKWLEKNMLHGKEDFEVATNEQRVEQVSQGILLFKVIMGFIVGISVVVGGIGVMNVLLISVTERTTEIGVRKAVGAKRGDIAMQFLCESITVSVLGCSLGLILGVLATMAFIPLIKALTAVEFYAAYTLNTMLIIALIAFLEGVIFGTYPAIRASRLDPVEAIRRE